MRFYTAMDGLFPRSFALKVFAVAFVGTHVPLIAAAGFALSETGGLSGHLDVLIVLLVATLLGSAATLIGLWALLAPVRHLRGAVEAVGTGIAPPPVRTDFEDEIGHLLGRAKDMAASVAAQVSVAQSAARTDPLTGLLNRRGFDAAVPGTASGAAIMIDIDRFKDMNDTFGHGAGDGALKRVAELLAKTLRPEDVLARHGGDEFVAWLPQTGTGEAAEIANLMRSSVAAASKADGRAITVSIGVAASAGPRALPRLFDEADRALLSAKARGRDCVVESPYAGFRAAGPADPGAPGPDRGGKTLCMAGTAPDAPVRSNRRSARVDQV